MRGCTAPTGVTFDQLKAEVEEGVRRGQRIVQPFIFQAVAETPADARDCSRIWARDKYPELGGPAHDRAARKANKKIRIGYVSGEFRQQATAILMAGVYDRHDREKFELIALDAGVSDQSPMRARLEKAFDTWIDIRSLSDQDAAGAIAGAGIDILVNLNGYFGDTRMGVFAQRPAPIQVNYLGFPATLGAPYMDYIIADKTVIPESEQAFYDEQVVYLPGCYQANDDQGREMARTPSRGEAGLPDEGFVFCNFNSSYKLTPETFDFLDADSEAGRRQRAVAAGEPGALRRKSAQGGRGARRCRQAADIRAGAADRSASGAPATGRSVPRWPALQCPHHRQRRAMGGRAADHPYRHGLRGPCRHQPA